MDKCLNGSVAKESFIESDEPIVHIPVVGKYVDLAVIGRAAVYLGP